MNQIHSISTFAFVAGLTFGCQTSALDAQPQPVSVKPTASAQQDMAAAAVPSGRSPTQSVNAAQARPAIEVQSVGSCEAAPELRGTLARVTNMVDRNHDGAISRDEASSAMNFLVGGMFFRADENSDGALSMAERDAAIKELRQEHGDVVDLMTALVPAEQWSQLRSTLEAEAPDKITLNSTRGAIQKGVDALFRVMDKNGNKVITKDESEQGVKTAFAALGKAAFDQADADNNQKLSTEEFKSAVETRLTQAFKAVDTNGDGSLTAAEAQSLMSTVGERLGAFTDEGSSLFANRVDVDVRR